MQLKRKELDVTLRMKEVDLQIQEERKRIDLMEVKKSNVVMEGSFEGEAQGRAVSAFMSALPEEFSSEQKLAVWEKLRELEKSAMVYSKVSSIEMYAPGTEVKRFDLNVEAGAKKFINEQPMLLPSILGYSGDGGVSMMNSGATSPSKAVPNAPKKK